MLVVALTGGIASGKSTVARILKELGCHVIDYDKISRSVVEPGKPAWNDIVHWFGREVLLPDETLNRPALGAIVFTDPEQRKKLESFVHPRISEEQKKMLSEIARQEPSAIVVIDVPLLYEVKLDSYFSKVILAYAPPDVQLQRLMARDGFSRKEAQSRLDAQIKIDDKVSRADFVIHNEGGLDETREQVENLYRELASLERSSKS
jgi:dephospho-CoA kinase